jgi:pimeloyl-[acyl-carrier protein] synthase
MYFDPMSQCWLVTGYEAIVELLNTEQVTSALGLSMKKPSPHTLFISKQMLFMDGEQHQRIRDIVSRQLAVMIHRMPEVIREAAHASIKRMRQERESDFVSAFASPVSLETISSFLGIPTHDREMLTELERWSDAFADATTGYFRYNMQDIDRLKEYFLHLIQKKKEEPANDLISAFLADQDAFHDEEALLANCLMVFTAGRTDIKRLLSHGITTMMLHWEELQATVRKDARVTGLISEELFRLVTPTRSVVRDVRKEEGLPPLFVHEHFLGAGQRILLYLEAGNRDPALFPQPEQFHLRRFAHAEKHLAFGLGSHRCPGAPLARLEARIALEELFSLPRLLPKPDAQPTWNANPTLGGFLSYPVLVIG